MKMQLIVAKEGHSVLCRDESPDRVNNPNRSFPNPEEQY